MGARRRAFDEGRKGVGLVRRDFSTNWINYKILNLLEKFDNFSLDTINILYYIAFQIG
jgi:hypothetical protein